MAWIFLLIAGFFEIGWAAGMKCSEGFSRFWPTCGTVLCMLGSFVFLTLAIKEIPLATAYAVWTGIGAAGTAVLGILIFGEPGSAARLVCIFMIIAGAVGLKFFANSAG